MATSNKESLYRAEVSGKCPFCGLDVAFGSNPPAAVHALPTCEPFDRIDALDFIETVKKNLP